MTLLEETPRLQYVICHTHVEYLSNIAPQLFKSLGGREQGTPDALLWSLAELAADLYKNDIMPTTKCFICLAALVRHLSLSTTNLAHVHQRHYAETLQVCAKVDQGNGVVFWASNPSWWGKVNKKLSSLDEKLRSPSAHKVAEAKA